MRKSWFKWHSRMALLAFIPLVLISVTGSILVFKVELDTWLMPAHMQVEVPPQQPRVNLNQLIGKVESSHPDYIVAGWELFDDKSRTDAAYLMDKQQGEWHKLYLNQYSGELLSTPVHMTHDLTDWLLSLHYTFLLGFTGTILGFVLAVILLALGISGIVLHRQFWKKLFTLRFKSARRIFYSDVHKLIGITSSPVLIILAVTGGYWNAAALLHEAEHYVEDHAHLSEKIYSNNIDFQQLLEQSSSDLEGFVPTYMLVPFEDDLHIMLFGEVPDVSILTSQYASVVTYDRESGELISAYDIREASSLNFMVDTFRKLHFGYFAGLTSKIVWCILGLSPLWLAMTGIYFYLFRHKKQVAKLTRKTNLNTAKA